MFRLVAASEQERAIDAAKTWFNLCYLASLLRAAKGDFVLLDQGMLQGLASVVFSARHAVGLEVFMRSLRDEGLLPDLAVLVEVSLKTAAGRLSARPGKESRVEEDPLAHLERYAAALGPAMGAFSSDSPHCRILKIRNEDGTDLSETGACLLNTILAIKTGT